MATLAGHVPVGIDKPVIGKIVVECLSIELVYVGFTSLVVGVTLFAFPCQRLARSPVNTGPLGAIGSDILVAVKAKLRL
jgi:hypothetical protein